MTLVPGSAKRVVVTGGCGFIGRHLVKELSEAGASITIIDDLSTGCLPSSSSSVRFVRGSVLDRPLTREICAGADLIFHLAGIVGMRLAHARRSDAYRVAAEGTRNILDAAGPAATVLFSSSAVYGLDDRAANAEPRDISFEGLLESDGGAPGYACGKFELERLGLLAAAQGRPVAIVRPFNVIGSGQSGAYGMVVPTFIGRALSDATLVVFGSGDQLRCFSCVETFISVVMRLLSAPAFFCLGSNVVNVGCGSSTSILELARIVIEETGSASPIEFQSYEAAFAGLRDTMCRIPCLERLEALIGPTKWPTTRDCVQRILGAGGTGVRLAERSAPVAAFPVHAAR